jgi:hypothetical protein
MPPGEERLDTS